MPEYATCSGSHDEDAPPRPAAPNHGGRRLLRRAATSPTRGASGAAAPVPKGRIVAGAKLCSLDVLSNLSSLEELVLTYDEIFGSTAMLLLPVFQKLERLRKVDLTRNHISKHVTEAIRAATPRKVEFCGDDLQTFFFY